MKTVPQTVELVKTLLELIAKQRDGFSQERVYLRAVGLVIGELSTARDHRLTDLLRNMGLNGEDWTAWYRLFQSAKRFKPDVLAQKLFAEALTETPEKNLFVVGGDITPVPRTSKDIEGTGWGKCPNNPPFKVGISLSQRYFNGCVFVGIANGYSRAIPVRFKPAFTEKATRTLHPAVKEQAAGIDYLEWVRERLDAAGRTTQTVLSLWDGSYDKTDFWPNLPKNTVALVRTAKNRSLTYFPEPQQGPGRRRTYGDDAPHPKDYLEIKSGWKTLNVSVRGHSRRMVYRVEGPFLRRGMANAPVFLICVRGQRWEKGNRNKRREPVFYLVNAVKENDKWVMPLSVKTLLTWAWQRWELEVTHREMKSVMGMGDKQAFHPQAAVSSVQWSAWVYGNLMLAGYRTYGLAKAVKREDAWRKNRPRRWTATTLLERCRVELNTLEPFRRLFPRSTHNWLEIEQLLIDQCLPSPTTSFFSP